MKIGFFGGTFDPIHIGHIHLALQMLEIHHLDQVVFCPASVSPYKQGSPPQVAAKHRQKMVELAIHPIELFSFCEWEITRPGPSFTIDTLKGLSDQTKAEKKEIHWHLILGEDALVDFASWKDVEELVALAPPLIGSRLIPSFLPPFPSSIKEIIERGMTKIQMLDISSTYLRKRLLEGKYCGHLLAHNVLDYIQHHQLYLPR